MFLTFSPDAGVDPLLVCLSDGTQTWCIKAAKKELYPNAVLIRSVAEI